MPGTGEASSQRETSERAGSVVGGRYRLVRKLGEGGMGVVYEAEHLRLKQRFAVKLLGRSLATGAFVARFEREARAAAQLESRHVARVFDVDTTEDGSPFFAMELLHGRDLHAELDLRGKLPWSEAARVVHEACLGMTDAHERGIIHRDLKPANLFLHRQDGGRLVKVLDFGISKSDREDVALTQTQQTLGTPLYMSPEQIRSPKRVDARTDVWSLGVILYETLTGRPPFFAETVTGIAVSITNDVPPDVNAVSEEVPIELAEVVRRAMSKRAEDRFNDARELGAALAPFAGPELADILPNAAVPSLEDALGTTVSADEAGFGPPPTAPTAPLPLMVPVAAPEPRSRRGVFLAGAGVVGIALIAWAVSVRGGAASAARDDASSSALPETPSVTIAAPLVPSAPAVVAESSASAAVEVPSASPIASAASVASAAPTTKRPPPTPTPAVSAAPPKASKTAAPPAFL